MHENLSVKRHAYLLAGLLMFGADALGDIGKISAVALFKDKAVISIDGKQRKLQVGQISPEGVKLIAAAASSAVLEVGGRRMELKLDGNIGGIFERGQAPKVIRLAPGANGHYFVDGAINGNPVSFVVDTGATSIAINKHIAKRLGVLYRTDGKRGQIETASGVVNAYYVTFDAVKIQTLELRHVEGVVVDGDFPSTSLLGQSFLNRLNMRREGILLQLEER
ncbi:MAG: TIGR02281 family clan AA aspartic protease [Gammaproteobacteria bacterium]|nr:TIGR02281 family clan AA aspartic protease [Gammaproteobacteria bacterium]